ncbi:Protein rhomboid [Frankliniella fusca]|uniref:Protein rhomboid n=1 Tax=Frankliniella fusca TaxID=407009 RepID=A0AAE1HGP2_9NEOP|nr:Protein rhomboid [Frankliniella fusca]
MAAPPRYPPARSDLILGLSDDDDEEDDDEEALDDSSAGGSGRDVGAEGLSSTPSTSSESDRSSLEAPRRTPPRPRVAKRTLRAELLERWPGWTSPARKRLRAASPARLSLTRASAKAPAARASPDRSTVSSYPATSSSPGSTLAVGSAASGAGLLVREYDRFWQLVERIASSPSLAPMGRGDDGDRVCFVHLDDLAPAPGAPRSATPTRWRRYRRSPRRSPPRSPSSSCTEEEDEDECRSEAEAAVSLPLPLPATFLTEDSRGAPPESLADPSDVDVLSEDLILPPPTPFSSPPPRSSAAPWPCPSRRARPGSPLARPSRQADLGRRGRASLAQSLADVRIDAPAAAPVAVSEDVLIPPDARDQPQPQPPRDELLERLQLLAGRPLPLPGVGDQDKVDVEEDSSVLQLLVLTPTDERPSSAPKGPVPKDSGGAGRPPPPPPWGVVKGRKAFGALLRLRVPYFFILVGIVQVTLYRMPSPLEAQELKNRFVWDSSRMFSEPWRTLSYAMLHSGQMHVSLNVAVQTIVGSPLEREQGALRVAGVYFGGAVYGALVTGVVSPALLMVGASAGIYSILMSHLAQIWLNAHSVRYGRTRAGAVLLLTGADMAYTAHHAIKLGNAAPRIGVTAHCAGAVSGLFLGLALYRTVSAGPGPAPGPGSCTKPAQYRAASIGSALLLGATAVFCLVWVHLAQSAAAAAAAREALEA